MGAASSPGAAKKAGIDVGRDQVARLMRANGLRDASRAKKRFTTHRDPAAVGAPDLMQRDFTATRPNEKWVADFTYCSTWPGVVYVAFVVDVFSRRIVGWKAARAVTAPLVVDALNMAAWTRRGVDIDGVICHSDTGSQHTSIAYTERLDDFGAAPSIGTVGDSYNNAMAESTIGLFKTELHRNPAALRANGGHWRGLDDLAIATGGWVGWFNEERFHGELDDLTPAEVTLARAPCHRHGSREWLPRHDGRRTGASPVRRNLGLSRDVAQHARRDSNPQPSDP